MAAARLQTAARSAYDSWLQDSKVFCAWARRFIASASVSSSKVATTSLLYGLTVRYAIGFLHCFAPALRRRLLDVVCLVSRKAALRKRLRALPECAMCYQHARRIRACRYGHR